MGKLDLMSLDWLFILPDYHFHNLCFFSSAVIQQSVFLPIGRRKKKGTERSQKAQGMSKVCGIFL
jgi:hypothetical protein